MFARGIEAGARSTDRARGDVDAAAVEALHRDLEALALLADAVANGDAAILEDHHRGGLRVPAQLLLLLAEFEARRVLLDDNGGDAFRPVAAGAHHADIK